MAKRRGDVIASSVPGERELILMFRAMSHEMRRAMLAWARVLRLLRP